MPAIAVYCSASERIDPVHVQLAADVGALIAARGHSLVSGGGSVSMMGAVAKAVREGGGRTYGVIPRALLEKEVGDRYADELVVTEGMRERKGLMDDAADAFVVLPGGLGTLEELLEVWSARTLALHAKPVVVCDPTGVLAPLRRAVDELVAGGFVQPAAAAAVTWTTSPEQALDVVEAELAGAGSARRDAPGVPHPAVRTQEGLEAGA
ncbi:TIGR00730 family Rossman fold protein [Streptomyces sp. NP160]|uniref:LOG family protein n=1 Tax=Streptomyces sp. NP160 TaxID=2586637 RepID=UPI00111AB624|nr:TIGR00730 family Rossman fold protein [Streptomyces sp. NP160]TNM68574.1 TIGR00730 family Rossman fold protein [Streptomyces sp. NP160]